MLRSGKTYRPEEAGMSEIAALLKTWMEESRKQEERRQEERELFEKARLEERRRYEEDRRLDREADRKQYEALLRGLTEGRPPRHVEVGPESLKLTRLGEDDDIEAFLTTFERAVEAHGVQRDKRSAILAPQLTGKARQAYAAMSDEDAKDYELVKAAIFRRYDINEETYRRRFREVKPKEKETPVELVIRVRDLAEKWLQGSRDRRAVVDELVKEQFIEVLPDEVRVWVKERKPRTSEEAGRLAEDYRQARKKDLWVPSTDLKKSSSKMCFTCKLPGHLARDCPKRETLTAKPGKGENATKPGERKRDEKPLICYNCGGKGHTSRQCPSEAFYGGARAARKSSQSKSVVNKCKGKVEGHLVSDIVLDTGCSRTLVHRDFVKEEKFVGGGSVVIQCAHGDVVAYPLANVELEVQGVTVTVEAAVSNTLPQSVLLGTDVPELFSLLGGHEAGQSLMAVTISRAQKLQRAPQLEPEELEDSSEIIEGAEVAEVHEDQSEVSPEGETREESVLSSEFNFGDDMFVDSRVTRPRRSKAESRRDRYDWACHQRLEGVPNVNVSKEELRKLQDKVKGIQKLRQRQPGQFVEHDGLLYHLWTPHQQPRETVEQLVLPEQFHLIVCKLAHTIPIAGHLGRDKTTKRISRRFFWPSMFRDVGDYCRRCSECQRTEKGNLRRVPLIPLPLMREPFERIALDIVGPLRRTRKGNQYILVICDYATRYPEAIPLRSIDAGTVAEHLIQLFARVGIPREILSDQGTNFMSQLLKELYNLLQIHQIRTSPYHPQTDGLVERFNRTLKSLLRKLVNKEGRDWDRLLPYILFAYREVPHDTTGFSPFELLYGREVRGPLDVLKDVWEANRKSDESVVSHILLVRERMEEMSEVVEENARAAQSRQKRWYDQTARERELEPNEEVLVLLPTSTNKLLAQWQGPYRVLRRMGKVNYEVLMPDKKRKRKVFHINMLKKWFPPVVSSFFGSQN